MTDTSPATAADAGPQAWTCPFCPLLCDTLALDTRPTPRLVGATCPKAEAALARFTPGGPPASPLLSGRAVALQEAVAAAATLLGQSRQPLFAGLGTDVAGARALYPLACATGAICDAAGGPALAQGLRVLQDRGRFSTTLAEVHERADLLLCVGTDPAQRHPLFFERCGLPSNDPRVLRVEPGAEELLDTVSLLAAAVEGRPLAEPLPEPLAALAARLREARYAVLVYETAALPAHGALVVEAINRIVASLNRSTRAAAMALGGGEGASTVNEVFTWLSGLPLRSRAGPNGLEHEPLRFDAARLLARGEVDLLLWASSFSPAEPPAAASVPRIVLGPPGVGQGAEVFIPVATPGLGAAGHLFRFDGSVVVPLRAVLPQGLPTVAEVVAQIQQALQRQRSALAATVGVPA